MSIHYLTNQIRTRSIESILGYGFIVRIALLLYGILHDNKTNHIKYTDIDYQVFTNGSKAILNGTSPFKDQEYRYTPLVALLFVPNILINEHILKFLFIIADILAGKLIYIINVYQGAHRLNSRLFLLIWLFNPVTIAISTRGSFEPLLLLIILSSIYFLITRNYILAGLLYGISIHIKLYPIIYAIGIYAFLVHKKPYLKNQSKFFYWFNTLTPCQDHYKFGLASIFALGLSCYLSFKYYGIDYVNQSFLYHLQRKDLQHNFSIYFYLFKLAPKHQNTLSQSVFVSQLAAILLLSIKLKGLDSNRRVRLRKLTFYLFSSTFAFVSLNKVCTSQYFTWYLIFIPLIADSVVLSPKKFISMLILWLSSQGIWLFTAYLYEYQHMLWILDLVGYSSIVFFITNLWILSTLTVNFDATGKWGNLHR